LKPGAEREKTRRGRKESPGIRIIGNNNTVFSEDEERKKQKAWFGLVWFVLFVSRAPSASVNPLIGAAPAAVADETGRDEVFLLRALEMGKGKGKRRKKRAALFEDY
jgi:hypothetical protein